MEATGSVNTTTISKYVMEEKWKQQFSCCEERGNWRQNSGEEEADVGGLHCHLRPCDVWACAATGAMSGSMTLPHPGFVLMFMAHVTTKGHAGACGLDHHLRPC